MTIIIIIIIITDASTQTEDPDIPVRLVDRELETNIPDVQVMETANSKLWARTLERDLAKQKNPNHPHYKDPLEIHAINVSRGRKKTTLDVDVSNNAGRGTSLKVILQNESKTIMKAGVITVQPSDIAWESDTDKIVIVTFQPGISAGKLECLESMTGMLQDNKLVKLTGDHWQGVIPNI